MPGHHHNPTAGTQNQGNSLGDRSSVRQSRLYRQYESGNDVKGLLGTGHLQWRLDQTEGAYKGKKTFDHKQPSSSTSSPSKQAEAAARLKAQMLHDELQQQQQREENISSLVRRSNAMYESQQRQQQSQPVRRPAPTRALPRFAQEEEDELSQLRERIRHLDALEAAEAEADARRGGGSENEDYQKYVSRADHQYLRSDAYIGPERRERSLLPREEETRGPPDYSGLPTISARGRGARNDYEQPQPQHQPQLRRRRYQEEEEDEDEDEEEFREHRRLPRSRDQPPGNAQKERWQRERERERQREIMEAEEREILERQRRLKAEIEMLQKISSNTAGPIGRLVKQEPPFALSPSKEEEERGGRRGRPRLGALSSSSHLQQQPLVLVQSAQERRSMEQTRSTRPW